MAKTDLVWPFDARDYKVDVLNARRRSRRLTAEETTAIETEIAKQIISTVLSYDMNPQLRRGCIAFMAYLAGVDMKTPILNIGTNDTVLRIKFFKERHAAIDNLDWNAHLIYAQIIADAGRLAAERMKMIQAKTDEKIKGSLVKLVTKNNNPHFVDSYFTEDRRKQIYIVYVLNLWSIQ